MDTAEHNDDEVPEGFVEGCIEHGFVEMAVATFFPAAVEWVEVTEADIWGKM